MINVIVGNSAEILKKIKEENKENSKTVFDFENNDKLLIKVYKSYFQSNLFGDKEIIIILNSKFLVNTSAKLKKKEIEMFKKIVSSTKIENEIFFILEKEINLKISYVKEMYKNFKVEKYSFNLQMKKFLIEKKINIKSNNLSYLREVINESSNIYNELLKLALKKDFNEISKEDIDLYIIKKPEFSIFKFFEDIVKKNYKQALFFYENDYKNLEYTKEQTLAIFASQIRFFLQLKLLLDKKSNLEIQSILKTSSYRIKLGTNVVKNVYLKDLIKIQSKVSEYEYLIKSGKTKEEEIILNFLIDY